LNPRHKDYDSSALTESSSISQPYKSQSSDQASRGNRVKFAMSPSLSKAHLRFKGRRYECQEAGSIGISV
jgi:hypothetical protein